jgi:hypothetical protein
MGWIKTYENWQAVIAEHYGDLANFNDIPTIRILFAAASREEKELCALLDCLKGKLADDDKAVRNFKDELNAVYAAKDELRKWLADRGLEP